MASAPQGCLGTGAQSWQRLRTSYFLTPPKALEGLTVPSAANHIKQQKGAEGDGVEFSLCP